MCTPRPRRFWSLALGVFAWAFTPQLLAQSLEDRVAEIERVNVTAHWRESAALIEALGADRDRLDPELAFRIGLIEARNFGLAGDYDGGVARLRELLERNVPSNLRLRALALATNLSSNISDHASAYQWLRDGLALVEGGAAASDSRFLAMASYLLLRAGEERKGLEYARRAIEIAREAGVAREECVSLSHYGSALGLLSQWSQAEAARREQLAVCARAGDPVFLADAHKGLGRALLEQGQTEPALPWIEQAESRFVASGFQTGLLETQMLRAEALLRLGRELATPNRLLDEVLPQFEAQHSWTYAERSHRLRAEIAEREGRLGDALAHLREAHDAKDRMEHDARRQRLAYLQVQFDTEVKDQQIALLESERLRQAAELEARQRTMWLQALGLSALVAFAALLVAMLWRSAVERRRYRELSEHDGLTGLYNHQSTLHYGGHAFERQRRQPGPFTAIVADIDRFKQINDRFGHAAGDAVLRELGQLLRHVLPRQAVVGRSGGEEFTILLGLGAAQSLSLIEQLRARIQPLAVFGAKVAYSLSYGLCEAGERHAGLEDLLRDADLALYRAKRSGRNRVVDASEGRTESRSDAGLVVVGSGIQLGRHSSQRCLSEIQEAEVVFALTDAPAFAMLEELRSDLIDLRPFYAQGKDRRQTYREMDAAIMAEVRAGKRVCAVFYGHPGVFADVPHGVIRKARAEGYRARMEPGISAEACLYADLGLDPGRHGVQSLEATLFLVENRAIDPRGLVLLWQVALTGDLACTRFHAEPEELRKLVERLLLDYPADHEVILYEAAHLPVEPFRAERLRLCELPTASYQEYTTLVIPPLDARITEPAQRLIEALRTDAMKPEVAPPPPESPAG